MRAFTSQHAALLAALRGERLVPTLMRRVSLERCSASDHDVAMLTDWPTALRESPGWSAIEGALETPSAWPDAWERARALGFNARADHHNALLFARLTDALVARDEHDVSAMTWRECLRSWTAVLSTDYVEALVADLVGDERVDELGDEIVSGLVEHLAEGRAGALVASLRLDDATIVPGAAPDRRIVRLHWAALDAILEETGDHDGAFGALARLRQTCRAQKERVVDGAISRLERALDALDLSQADGDAILAPFEWFNELFALIGHHEASSTMAVRRVVDLGWKLRKLDRDEDGDFARILELMQPFNADLCARHNAKTAFGHNSKCADYLTFQAEMLSEASARRELLSAALQVCPGHRNASMLMSYAHLNRANALMNMIKLYPGLTGSLPGASDKIEGIVLNAWSELEASRAVWPHNESVDAYRDTVRSEAQRFGVTLPEDTTSEDTPDE